MHVLILKLFLAVAIRQIRTNTPIEADTSNRPLADSIAIWAQ